ncbi:MAG TPA: S-layer protein domain-containing protein [Methanothrix sp.]|nr:S-layer protein domain-containing protein [Methanothrix sp.]
MKKLTAITFTSMVLLLATAMAVGAVDSVEIRGKVATEGATWTADDFAGFYYDLDDNIKTEELTTTLTDNNKLAEPNGVAYTTTAQKADFEYEPWGSYNVIGFMAEKYFAGYLDTPDTTDDVLFHESKDENVLSDEQVLQILVDNDDERTVTSGTPLDLEEGYELAISAIDIDGNKVYLELQKDGVVVDSKVISPSKTGATMKDQTYYYKKDIGDSKDVVIVAAHFKNAFRGADTNLATVDGLWQLSDTPKDVSENTEYDKMTIQTVTADTITMNNEDNDITLSKNKDITLMPGVSIRTADADELRYYIYKEITEPGVYEIRGNVATDTYTWNADNFAGFYYDIDDNIKTEELTATITGGNKLAEPNGVTYTTTAQKADFEYEPWGSYNVIGFMAEKYFAGYLDTPDTTDDVLFHESKDENVLSDEQVLQILVDNDDERTVTSGTPLDLEEGYELAISAIDIDGNKVYLELQKDGVVVDSKVISPSKTGATMKDQTYYYKKDIGDSKDVVIVAAHFKNAFRGADTNLATVDGLWQLSDTPKDVSENTEYDKMTIQTVTADTITMNNEDNDITLSKNKDITLMPGVSIKTADADELRYYIYKEATIKGEEAAPTPVEAAPAVAETEKETAVEKVETAAAEEVNKTAEEAKAVEEEVKKADEPAKAEENKTAPQAPGFSSIFALTGLLAVAYLVLSRRD